MTDKINHNQKTLSYKAILYLVYNYTLLCCLIKCFLCPKQSLDNQPHNQQKTLAISKKAIAINKKVLEISPKSNGKDNVQKITKKQKVKPMV